MAKQVKYHMIKNFTNIGDLGISTKAINEIAKAAILEIDGVEIPESHTVFFKKDAVSCRFNPLGELIVDIDVLVKYGYNVEEICSHIQERVEQAILFSTEIKPKKINIQVENINSKQK